MPAPLPIAVLMLALCAAGPALAQNKVRTETIRPASPQPRADSFTLEPAAPNPAAPEPQADEIIADPAQLPPAVAHTRERILAAARSGDLESLADLMQASETVFSVKDEKNPAAFWRAQYPESGGLEAMAILTVILETGFVHADRGTPREMYVWPYFARVPLDALSAEQKVDLFRIVTGADYKTMRARGGYSFYRVGIAADGSWRYFLARD